MKKPELKDFELTPDLVKRHLMTARVGKFIADLIIYSPFWVTFIANWIFFSLTPGATLLPALFVSGFLYCIFGLPALFILYLLWLIPSRLFNWNLSKRIRDRVLRGRREKLKESQGQYFRYSEAVRVFETSEAIDRVKQRMKQLPPKPIGDERIEQFLQLLTEELKPVLKMEKENWRREVLLRLTEYNQFNRRTQPNQVSVASPSIIQETIRSEASKSLDHAPLTMEPQIAKEERTIAKNIIEHHEEGVGLTVLESPRPDLGIVSPLEAPRMPTVPVPLPRLNPADKVDEESLLLEVEKDAQPKNQTVDAAKPKTRSKVGSRSLRIQARIFTDPDATLADYLANLPPALEGGTTPHSSHDQELLEQEIGNKGELFCLGLEQSRLKGMLGANPKYPIHAALEYGNKFGCDIVSLKTHDKIKYLEVKTTLGPLSTPFFLTPNELKFMRNHPDSYEIYRVYNFDLEKGEGQVEIVAGLNRIEELYILEPIEFSFVPKQ